MYSNFVSTVKTDMNDKLNPRRIRLKDSVRSNKLRRSKKPWWTEELSRMWNDMCDAEKKWRRDTGTLRRKSELKQLLYIIDSIILILLKAITYNLYIYIIKGE